MSNVLRQRLQRLRRVRHDDDDRIRGRARDRGGIAHHGARRPALERPGHERVAVEALPADGEEEIAGRDRP